MFAVGWEGGDGRRFRCGHPHFLVQKKFGFFEIYSVTAPTRRSGRVEAVRTFCGQGGRDQFFAILGLQSFMDLLWSFNFATTGNNEARSTSYVAYCAKHFNSI